MGVQQRGLQIQELLDIGVLDDSTKDGLSEVEILRRIGISDVKTKKGFAGCFIVVYGWFLNSLSVAYKNKTIENVPSTMIPLFQENISKIRAAGGDLLMYLAAPVPLGYTHLLRLMVTIYIVVASAGLIPKLLWVAPFASVIVTLFFSGFLAIGTHMLDPFHPEVGFGFNLDDFFHGTSFACRSVERSVPFAKGVELLQNQKLEKED